MKQTKRELTNHELREWGEELGRGESWEGVDADEVFKMMTDTAGNEYDAGMANWDFDKTDAERMLALVK